ncbi:death effector domain-containing protein-like [Parus major]|uniref:death effector domain-containing protein-like n=1 Tax=Parus major TaxID=9157 RepID=UPI001444541C|nr:death effector domain-containing protein-like [Parus major]
MEFFWCHSQCVPSTIPELGFGEIQGLGDPWDWGILGIGGSLGSRGSRDWSYLCLTAGELRSGESRDQSRPSKSHNLLEFGEFQLPKARISPRADIRLRVRAEYCQHDSALHGNVFSNKQDPLERQFERFNQANTILKSRDLGSIICDIKFSELTYLDAFWRDYINGSLLEALKGVFITDSLKQAVGHEAIKLLVNVDEEDYELGRQKLLRNLMLHTAP